MKWLFIDGCQNTCQCSMNDPIQDLSHWRPPKLTVDPVHSMPHPSTMNEQCNDNKSEIRTIQEQTLLIRIHRTNLLMDIGNRILRNSNNKVVDRSHKIHSTTWLLDPTSTPLPAVGIWPGGAVVNGRMYRFTKRRSVNLHSKPTRWSLGSTMVDNRYR